MKLAAILLMGFVLLTMVTACSKEVNIDPPSTGGDTEQPNTADGPVVTDDELTGDLVDPEEELDLGDVI